MDLEIKESEEEPKQKHKAWQGMQLWIVQSSVCLLAILITVCLKMIGGNAYAVVAELFHSVMLEGNVFPAPSASVQTVSASVKERELQADAWAELQSLDENDEPESVANLSVSAPLTNGVLTSPFGERTDPFDSSAVTMHYGVDIAAPEGTPLHALMTGKVVTVGYSESGYGHYCLIETEDSHQYLYAHCSEIFVIEGENVEVGVVIAAVGNTGRSTGSHVHIEWRENGQPIDPALIIPSQTYA